MLIKSKTLNRVYVSLNNLKFLLEKGMLGKMGGFV